MKNMKNPYVIVTVSVVLAVVLAAFFIRPVQNVVNKVTDNGLGSVTGPDSYFPCETHNGVQTCFARMRMNQATTTVCALRSPAATSTLTLANASYSVSSTTASVTTIAKATTAYATTTLLAAGSLAANAQGSIVASTTANAGATVDGTLVFAPNTWLVVGMAGGTGTMSPSGVCNARWDVLF